MMIGGSWLCARTEMKKIQDALLIESEGKKRLGVDMEFRAQHFLAWEARSEFNRVKSGSVSCGCDTCGFYLFYFSMTVAAFLSLFMTAAAISPSSSIPSTYMISTPL